MRHQYSPNQKCEQGFSISSWQQRTEGMSEIGKKRQDFHKEIRKQQIDDIIKAKRKLYFENNINTPNLSSSTTLSTHKRTLTSCITSIKEKQHIQYSICSLVNILALQKPFQHFSVDNHNPSAHVIELFCTDLVNLMFNCMIYEFPNDIKKRIFCLNALANLFADLHCQNVRYVKVVVETIDAIYGGVDNWGCDEEMEQVYYMIANLIRKNVVHTHLLSIEKLLAWGEAGVSVLPSDPFRCLTQSFTQLFSYVDQHFNSRNNSFFTDHFRPSRQIIIQNMIKRVISTAHGSKLHLKGNLSLDSDNLLSVFQFFNKNKQYLLKVVKEWEEDEEDKKWIARFVDKIIHLINQQTLKSRTLNEIGGFLLNLLRYYSDMMQDVDFKSNSANSHQQDETTHLNCAIQTFHKKLLTSNNISQIMISICHQNFECKIIYLKVMYELLAEIGRSLQLSSEKELFKAFQFILVDKKMEDVLAQFVNQMNSKIRSVDILKIIVDIYRLVIHAGNGKLGLHLRDKFKFLLNEAPQYIPKEIFAIVEERVNSHYEHINSIDI